MSFILQTRLVNTSPIIGTKFALPHSPSLTRLAKSMLLACTGLFVLPMAGKLVSEVSRTRVEMVLLIHLLTGHTIWYFKFHLILLSRTFSFFFIVYDEKH